MTNNIKLLSILVFLYIPTFGQQADLIINQVKAKQKSISSIFYQVSRTDTLGTYVRHMEGRALIERAQADTIFGFKFWSKKTADPTEKMYDGHVGYSIDSVSKAYEITTSPTGFHNLLNGGGGHMIVPDLLNLKADGIKSVSVIEEDDNATYLLTFKYPDIDQYNITNKFKALRIDKKTFLIRSVREHQESLGRIQDLYYEINNPIVNPSSVYNFAEPAFLKSYKHLIPSRKPSPVFSFLGSAIPDFKLQTFINGNELVPTSAFKGQVVLLDFWEVWCGPCVESMPKIDELYKKYKSEGLQVYGIVNDPANITSAKTLVKTKGFNLPMLMGSEKLRNELKITGVPLYLLIDRSGKVSFISEGYSEMIENEIIKALAK